MNWANKNQWPGGVSEAGPSAQYSAMTFCWSVRPALMVSNSSTSALYAAGSAKNEGGGPGRNCEPLVMAKGTTRPQNGVLNEVRAGSRNPPWPSGTCRGCQ